MNHGADHVADKVRALIMEMLPSSIALGLVYDDAVLDEEMLGFDSIALTDLLCSLEEHFDVELPVEVVLETDAGLTVAALIGHVRERAGGRGL